jgi:hypothetical protein
LSLKRFETKKGIMKFMNCRSIAFPSVLPMFRLASKVSWEWMLLVPLVEGAWAEG